MSKINEKLLAAGLDPINDEHDVCPERTAYVEHLLNGDKGDKDYAKVLKYLEQEYLLNFHKYVSSVYPHLLFELDNDKTYWNYDETTGVYREISFPQVRSLIIQLLLKEGFTAKANEAFAKSTLNKYKGTYPMCGVYYDDFDKESDWFHAENGWVHLDTLEFIEHTPEKLSRWVSAVAYDADATCPIYDNFLDEQLHIKKDEVRVIDQFSGLVLTDEIKYEKMLTLVGRSGCGKSTLLNIWRHLLGDLAIEKSLHDLGDTKFIGSSLVDKRLCWFDEVDIKRSEMSNALGKFVTGQFIRIERKGIDGEIHAKNKMKCVLTANRLPLSSEDGTFRRLLLIYLEHSFTEHGEADVNIMDKLKKESSGILNRMLRGLKDLREMKGFTVIDGHGDRIEEYMEISDPLVGFLKEFFEPAGNECEVSTKQMFEAYREYRPRDSFVQNLTPQKFGLMMRSQPSATFSLIKVKKKRDGNVWTGIKLKKDYNITVDGRIEINKF